MGCAWWHSDQDLAQILFSWIEKQFFLGLLAKYDSYKSNKVECTEGHCWCFKHLCFGSLSAQPVPAITACQNPIQARNIKSMIGQNDCTLQDKQMQQKVVKNTRGCPGRAALLWVKCRCGAGVWDLTDGPTNLLFNARANIGPADYQHLIVPCVGKDYVKQKPPGCGATLRVELVRSGLYTCTRDIYLHSDLLPADRLICWHWESVRDLAVMLLSIKFWPRS